MNLSKPKKRGFQHHRNLDLYRPYFEEVRWENGPVCHFCGESDPEKFNLYKGHRGVRWCHTCKKQFSPLQGTPFEGSHMPYWLIWEAMTHECRNTYHFSLVHKINYRSAMRLMNQVQEFLDMPYK